MHVALPHKSIQVVLQHLTALKLPIVPLKTRLLPYWSQHKGYPRTVKRDNAVARLCVWWA
jgi:hypothetical protein